MEEGNKYGKWLVIERVELSKSGIYYLCQCECGTTRNICGTDLRAGRTRKCKRCQCSLPEEPHEMVGKLFGDWQVIREVRTGKPARHFECLCKCGASKIIRADTLRTGRSARCAECRHNNLCKTEEMLNKRFGKWIVIKEAHTGKNNKFYECLCDCGERGVINASALRRGRSQQCKKCSVYIHGMSTIGASNHGSPTYNTWRCMRERCNNPKHESYKHYGARGITICERWMNSFKDFLEDMGEKPEGKQIDRIDPNGNYEPVNCRWVTPKENSNNRRRNGNQYDQSSKE